MEKNERDIMRIAGLYHGIVLEQLEALAWDRLMFYEDLKDGGLRLVIKAINIPVAEQPLFFEDTPMRVRLAALSFDHCVKVIATASGILALLTKEVHIGDPLPARRLEVWRQDEDETCRVTGAQSHTILKITSTLSSNGHTGAHSPLELIADPTHQQYWFESGIETYSLYKQHKSRSNGQDVTEEKFGTLYKDFRGHFRIMMKRVETTFGLILGQALLRTTNNAVYAEMKEIGGRDALLELDDKLFSVAQEGILKALRKALQELRVAMERVHFWVEYEHEHEEYLSLLEQATGEGHRACDMALENLLYA
ncbi:hypothetical protein BDU57DRAFT_532427 [Ampelomyces quisqualis]|uniref:Uncharacterized protein n=1 Tax=Ampelomyces quisqualis TaxID=50730 RepID=A0A6A5QEX0_AMPQU|nr:hypothetical protein BDU57DRAFT_532427 [Ampelomyces quisqualis]